jgi:hypothetical protein
MSTKNDSESAGNDHRTGRSSQVGGYRRASSRQAARATMRRPGLNLRMRFSKQAGAPGATGNSPMIHHWGEFAPRSQGLLGNAPSRSSASREQRTLSSASSKRGSGASRAQRAPRVPKQELGYEGKHAASESFPILLATRHSPLVTRHSSLEIVGLLSVAQWARRGRARRARLRV